MLSSVWRDGPAMPRPWVLRRNERERTEFVTLSFWESREAIRSFAGEDIEQAVFYSASAESFPTPGAVSRQFGCRNLLYIKFLILYFLSKLVLINVNILKLSVKLWYLVS